MAILKLESEQAIKTKDKIKTSKNLIRVNTKRIAKFKEDILSSNNYREISEFCEHIKDEVKKNELGDYQLYSEMNKGQLSIKRGRIIKTLIEKEKESSFSRSMSIDRGPSRNTKLSRYASMHLKPVIDNAYKSRPLTD